MTIHMAARTARSTRAVGWVPFTLVALVVVPAIAGSLRLIELAGGAQLIPANPRITASPVPVIVHLGGGWAISLAVAEYVIRRPARRRAISRTTINHRSIRATVKVGSL